MPERAPQTFANHARFHPPFHFFLTPVLLVTVIIAVVGVFRNPGLPSGWLVILCLALLLNAFLTRTYALKVQDRVIRLEERLRLERVLPGELRRRSGELTEGQLVALRFAPDDELPLLVEYALTRQMSPKDIKQAIQT